MSDTLIEQAMRWAAVLNSSHDDDDVCDGQLLDALMDRIEALEARATAAEAENARLADENAALREALATVRDYVADASTGALIYFDSGEGYIAMAKEDLARVDAALESRNVG